jgi:succinate dehydrogenase subunit C
MSEQHAYTPYHPRWLRRPVSTYWWMEKWSYFRFILRESTCMFVAWSLVYLLLLIRAVSRGTAHYAEFLEWSATPWVLALNIISFVLVVFHAVTFFEAVPQAIVVHIGRSRVPGQLVKAGHYIGWAAVSAFVVWLIAGA